MPALLDGIRVLEVAIYGFVPSAGAVLADWGASVIKVEHPEHGDPMRGLASWGVEPGTGGVTHLWEIFNRGKKSIGVDLATAEGRELLLRLVDESDVFLTNFLSPARRKLGIDAPEITARNPRIIYGRGTGYGPSGPDADAGGFDGISYWARTGAASSAMPRGGVAPIGMPGPAYGDIQSGMHLAGGISAALFHRERTGEGQVVDTSLFGSGLWAMQPTIGSAFVSDVDELPKADRTNPTNPLANVAYETADGRYIAMSMLESDRYWSKLCEVIGRPELASDERFANASARRVNAAECVKLLDQVFLSAPLDYWTRVLSTQNGQWAAVRLAREALDDPQVEANGYVQEVHYDNGSVLPMVVPPVQFSVRAPVLRRAPSHGEDTDSVLLELGIDHDELMDLKIKGVIT